MTWLQLGGRTAILLGAAIALVADRCEGATLRYRQSGDWTQITDGASPGWGPNGGGVGAALPGAADDARINFGNNTVTVTTTVPTVNRVQIGVDESGIVQVNAGGVLTSGTDILAGNNNSNATGQLIVKNGGVVNVGRILWAANTSSNGVINIESGGLVNVASHLWWGVTGAATVDVSGTLQQTGGILGLGTNNASTPSGGAANVTIRDGGLLALFNISSAAGLPSIQTGSLLSIEGSGQLTLPGDFVGTLNSYADAGKLVGIGGTLMIDQVKNPGFTTAYLIPEPASLLLLGMAVPFVVRGKRN